jgi:hypothetical protein
MNAGPRYAEFDPKMAFLLGNAVMCEDCGVPVINQDSHNRLHSIWNAQVVQSLVLADEIIPAPGGETYFGFDVKDTEYKLALLRIQLFTAMQTLEGENLAEFWKMIDDLQATRRPE